MAPPLLIVIMGGEVECARGNRYVPLFGCSVPLLYSLVHIRLWYIHWVMRDDAKYFMSYMLIRILVLQWAKVTI